MSNTYKTLQINNQEIFIVENHHEVLMKWQEAEKCNMITFDCHTDTQPAFENYLYKNKEASLNQLITDIKNNKLNIAKVISMLKNTEHIDFATKVGFINKAFVVSPASSTLGNKSSQIIEYNGYSIFNNLASFSYQQKRSMALDNKVINAVIEYIKAIDSSFFNNYILDIDLDYINTLSVFDQDLDLFRQLIKNAKFVTIAKEPRCVAICYENLVAESEDDSTFVEMDMNADIVLDKLLSEIKKID